MSTVYAERLELLDIALAAAREAAALSLQGFRKRVTVEHKGAIDLVTEFDRRCEALVQERLRSTGLPVIGEEGAGGEAAESAGSGAVWYVDPIDGTTNFVHGHPHYCVSIGLVEDGLPVVGAVIAPALRLEWTGAIEGTYDRRLQGDGRRLATRRDTVTDRATDPAPACTTSSTQVPMQAMLATGFPYDVHTSDDNNVERFASVVRHVRAIRRCGAAALDMCHVAEGTYDGYWELKIKPWDVAAGMAIVVAAGGTASRFDGTPHAMRAHDILVSNGPLHDPLIRLLAKR